MAQTRVQMEIEPEEITRIWHSKEFDYNQWKSAVLTYYYYCPETKTIKMHSFERDYQDNVLDKLFRWEE